MSKFPFCVDLGYNITILVLTFYITPMLDVLLNIRKSFFYPNESHQEYIYYLLGRHNDHIKNFHHHLTSNVRNVPPFIVYFLIKEGY